jgi:hypothetical protein
VFKICILFDIYWTSIDLQLYYENKQYSKIANNFILNYRFAFSWNIQKVSSQMIAL